MALLRFIGDVAIHKHSTIYTNDNRNATKIHKLVNFNDSNLLQRKQNIQIL